jgi:hypothetical protein
VQLAIDSILMTLLVGVMLSIALASIVFVLGGFSARIPIIGHLFDYFLMEKDKGKAGVVTKPRPDEGTSHSMFQGLLLLACLFGLGIVGEGSAERINNSKFSDSLRGILGVELDDEIRVQSFISVGKTEINSGRPNDQLRRIYTDYQACNAMLISNESDFDGPCSLISKRVEDFYYHAKNTVFSKETYFEELDNKQSRIDFMQSIAYSLLFIGLVFAASFFISAFAEFVEFVLRQKLARHSVLLRAVSERWLSEQRRRDSLARHIKDLAATRLAIFALAATLTGGWALDGWADLEQSFDRRVFGYYLCSNCQIGSLDERDAVPGSKGAVSGVPDSPYRVFSSPHGHFEPSAVASLGLVEGLSLFVVGNDKDANRLYLFELTGAGKLVYISDVALDRDVDQGQLKIEALSISNDGGVTVRPSRIFIAGRRTVKGPKGDKQEPVIYQAAFPRDLTKQTTGIRLRLETVEDSGDICRLARGQPGVRAESDRCDIEALAYREASGQVPESLVVGVRSVGKFGQDWVPQLFLASVSLSGPAYRRVTQIGTLVMPDGKGPECGFMAGSRTKHRSAYGLSDAAFVNGPEGSQEFLLLLTSFEWSRGCVSKVEQKYLINQVESALWSIPIGAISTQVTFERFLENEEPQLQYRLAHKAEGIAPLFQDSEAVLVIFDDDASRKGVDRAPDTFPLHQNESVYVTLKLKK